MEIDKQKAIEVAMKHINIPGLLIDELELVLKPALDKVVADSANPYDDMAMAALYPVLKPALEKAIQDKWAELLGSAVA